MFGKRVLEQPSNTLRLNFFSPMSTTPSRPTKAQPITVKLTKAPSAERQVTRIYVQCDC